jgi:hypothetical protein
VRHLVVGTMLAFISAAGAFLAAITGRFDEAIGWIAAVVGVVGALSTMASWEWADFENAMGYTVTGVAMLLLGAGATATLHLLEAFGWAAVFPALLALLGIANAFAGAEADRVPPGGATPAATPTVTTE